MILSAEQKLGFGSVLAALGGFGIVISPLLGWTGSSGAWDFPLGFIFGLCVGLGAGLVVFGLIERRSA